MLPAALATASRRRQLFVTEHGVKWRKVGVCAQDEDAIEFSILFGFGIIDGEAILTGRCEEAAITSALSPFLTWIKFERLRSLGPVRHEPAAEYKMLFRKGLSGYVAQRRAKVVGNRIGKRFQFLVRLFEFVAHATKIVLDSAPNEATIAAHITKMKK
jgi:hypothetical protein